MGEKEKRVLSVAEETERDYLRELVRGLSRSFTYLPTEAMEKQAQEMTAWARKRLQSLENKQKP